MATRPRFTLLLDTISMLSSQSLSKAHREPLRGVARGVLLAFGIALCFPTEAGSTKPKEYVTYKEYALHLLNYDYVQHKCLTILWGKESAWNPKAVGNPESPSKSYTYGLLQMKNPIAKDKSAIEQIHLGLKYIDHRYDGDTCKAWTHWIKRGWH